MIRLSRTLSALQSPAFKAVFEQEVRALDRSLLPLLQGMSHGSQLGAAELGVMVIGAADHGSSVRVKAGIFFTSVIAGCSCADDPTPIGEIAEYCELLFDIDKGSANTQVTLQVDAC